MANNAAKKFIPLLDRILVRKITPEITTKSGLYLPDSAKNPANTAKVIAVGPGKRNNNGELIPTTLSVGDVVFVPEYGGTPLKIDNEEFHVYREDEFIGKMSKEGVGSANVGN
ncbi:chaperonin GroES [Babesia microti strain RI]|uniref:Chaperonin GroES n=1 Tax=Babesia microti (strain RI) TaxID=1133968 RepID=I7IPV2_BABMR|nr:chaperonin GroES [Babesia microti strain RI]CCF73245.1 chaperonin GroES [Babesia microti strain RI]|eukprot:XP_012647854.1 chaperonin GroES [Babesia microti strain RI]